MNNEKNEKVQKDQSNLTVKSQKLEQIGVEIGRLVGEKNLAYGDAFEKSSQILAVLYPQGIHVSQYKDMLGTVRVIDKLFRIATSKDALGENPWRDIGGYGILGSYNDTEPTKNKG